MTSNSTSKAAVLATVMLSGCAITEQALQQRGLRPLNQSQLEVMYAQPRQTVWTDTKGRTGVAIYLGDGQAAIDRGRGVGFETASLERDGSYTLGTWRAVDGQFCTRFEAIDNGAERCVTHYQISDDEYRAFNPDGSYAGAFSFRSFSAKGAWDRIFDDP